MRMRKKPNLPQRFERSTSVRIDNPKDYIGKWRTLYPEARSLFIEVGCGKGKFTIETALAHPEMLLIAVEKVPDCLIIAMEAAVQAGTKNLFFISEDAGNLTEIFDRGEVDGIYLNFSDPWPRKKNAKRRLTHRTFLERYEWILSDCGRVEFKSDNPKLFEFTLEEMQACGWMISEKTDNLHENGPVGIMTGYEIKFYEQGIPIHRVVGMPTSRPNVKPETPDEIREKYDPDFKA